MIHVASLMHDDVIDSANTRRGLQALNSVFGNKARTAEAPRQDSIAWKPSLCPSMLCWGNHGAAETVMQLYSRSASLFCGQAQVQSSCSPRLDQHAVAISRLGALCWRAPCDAGAK